MPPPQDSASRPPVLHLITEARMPYDVASAILSHELKGTKIDVQKTFDDRFVKKATVLLEDSNNAELETDDRRPEIDLETIRD